MLARPQRRELALYVAENAANGERRMGKKRRGSSHRNYSDMSAGCESCGGGVGANLDRFTSQRTLERSMSIMLMCSMICFPDATSTTQIGVKLRSTE